MIRNSIKSSIILTSLVGVGIILTVTALTANWFIVGWLEDNFDSNLLTKGQVLVTLFTEDDEGLEFNFADEFMPEFERSENPEYFQFWSEDGRTFERSNSLKGRDLEKLRLSSEPYLFHDRLLIDGTRGRLLQMHFVPQLEPELRSNLRTNSGEDMVLVLARERESLDLLILVVNVTLLMSIPAILLFIFFAIRLAADRGLRPLEELKSQLRNLDVNHLTQPIVLSTPVMDMENIVLVINGALERISESFKREQRFTSDAAHELRTPIAELINMAEVAKKWPDKVDRDEFSADVLKSSAKMHLIVNSLLELARCKNNQIVLNISEFNVYERFKDCWNLLRRDAEKKNITFKFSGDEAVGVLTSFTEFDRVISNLLSNAVEYGTINSTIAVNTFEDDGLVSIAISNKTEILDEKDLPHLFDSLWRKDESRNSENHIGMGLTIVRAYSELLNLDIKTTLTDQLFSVVVSGLRSAKGP